MVRLRGSGEEARRVRVRVRCLPPARSSSLSFLPAAKPSGPRTVQVVLLVVGGGEQFDVNLWLSYVISFSHL